MLAVRTSIVLNWWHTLRQAFSGYPALDVSMTRQDIVQKILIINKIKTARQKWGLLVL